MVTYKIKLIRPGLELEVEGDKKFVVEMLNRFESGNSKPIKNPTSDGEMTVSDVTATKTLSVGEFIRKIGYKKDVDIVLAFGYYLEKHVGLNSFAPTDINACYYDAKMESSNTSQSIIYLIRKGYLMGAKLKEKSKKKYTLTTSGIEYIEEHLSNRNKETAA